MDTLYQPGQAIITNYVVDAVIGPGGFSEVYKVRNIHTNKVQVVKLFTNVDDIEGLLREYNIMSGLRNKHIAEVFDAGKLADGHPYILCEFAGDEDLSRYVRPSSLLSLAQVSDVGQQVLEALCYMHQNKDRLDELRHKGTISEEEYRERMQLQGWGFYHRDIKPANIVVSPNDDPLREADALLVRLVDFNASRGTYDQDAPNLLTLEYLAPDWENLNGSEGEIDLYASRDLFALGVTLYQLATGHHPWERGLRDGISYGEPNYDPPRDPRLWQPRLPAAWADFLLLACAPYAGERFATARKMLVALQLLPIELEPATTNPGAAPPAPIPPTRAAAIRLLAWEVDKPDYNPYVSRFLTMYSQARAGNRGTRSGPAEDSVPDGRRQDGLTRATYVPTMLDNALMSDILEGVYRLVIISGNAGDGKTAFIRRLEEQAGAASHPLEESNNGCRFFYNNLTFNTNYDGSQDEEDSSNTAVLERFFAPFADLAQPAELIKKSSGHVYIIAINEGRLRTFLEHEHQTQARYSLLYKVVTYSFTRQKTDLPRGLLIVNLNLRSLVADAGPTASIYDRQLEAMLDESFWQPCLSCRFQDKCYIKFNADSLRDPSSGAAARRRLRDLLEVTHLRRVRHATMRDLRSLLAYLLCADSSCEDIAAQLADGDPDPRYYVGNYYYNITDMERGTPSADQPDNTTPADPLLRLMTQSDIAAVANPLDDRSLYFDARLNDDGWRVFGRSGYESSLIARLQQQVAQADGPTLAATTLYRLLRRKAYFERRRDERASAMLPYLYFDTFRQALRNDTSLAEANEPLGKLKLALLRGLSFTLVDERGRAALPADNGVTALYLRASSGKNEPTIFSYRKLEAANFYLSPKPLDRGQASYLEYQPDTLQLEYRRQPDADPDTTMEVSLDLFELIMLLADGYMLPPEAEGAFLNVEIFLNTLARLPYRELLLLDPSAAARYVIRAEGQQLSLSRVEEVK